MKLKTLYSRTSTGAVQEWTIEVDNNKYRTVSGQTDGKKVTSEWTILNEGKNTGKTNATSAEEQALKEAKALHKKKLETGYFENVEDIDNVGFIEPMLAKKYEDYSSKLNFKQGVFSQPKLDGIRMVLSWNSMQSRNGKQFKSVPHILKNLGVFFAKHPQVVLDGELYCNKFNNDFNKICSIVKKTKPTAEDLAESAETIQYWVYDCIVPNMSFEERSAFLHKELKSKSIVIVPTVKVKSFADLDELNGLYISDGYEGQMVRTNETYQNKRTDALLKRKEFQDDEFDILDIAEGVGNRTGVAGFMCFETKQKTPFRASIKGSFEYCEHLLKNKKKYIGSPATVKYFNLTPENKVPRFPVVIAIRNYE